MSSSVNTYVYIFVGAIACSSCCFVFVTHFYDKYQQNLVFYNKYDYLLEQCRNPKFAIDFPLHLNRCSRILNQNNLGVFLYTVQDILQLPYLQSMLPSLAHCHVYIFFTSLSLASIVAHWLLQTRYENRFKLPKCMTYLNRH